MTYLIYMTNSNIDLENIISKDNHDDKKYDILNKIKIYD